MLKQPGKAATLARHAVVLAGLFAAGVLVFLAIAQARKREAQALLDPPREVSQRHQAIAAELKQLQGHAWAAEYYQGDGDAANVTMSLAPQSGVTGVGTGCFGLYASNEGRIQALPDGRLVFRFNRANEKEPHGFPEEVVPVRWGARRYLISSAHLVDFVNAIHHGDEPRDWVHGRFLLAKGDETRPATGLPSLPSPFLQGIRHQALDVEVVRIEPKQEIHPERICTKRYRVTVNHGHADGLVPGVVLRLKRHRADALADLRIDASTASQASGEIGFYESDCTRPHNVPDLDWTFTTGAYGRSADQAVGQLQPEQGAASPSRP